MYKKETYFFENHPIYHYIHKKTGAQIVIEKNNNLEKKLQVGFKTLCFDDTGVNHILEHTILNGSNKYRVPNMIHELANIANITNINASTWPLCTCYNAASTEEKDLITLADIFLSSAFDREKGKVLVAVSEGIHYADGTFVSEAETSATDGFGHVQLGGLAALLADAIRKHSDAKVRGIELSLLQRCAAHIASKTDIDEAFGAGQEAVRQAVAGVSGKMVAFERETVDGAYHCRYVMQPLDTVANVEKKIPPEWINEEGNGLTKEFIDYVRPLVQGEPELPLVDSMPRYANLKKVLAGRD